MQLSPLSHVRQRVSVGRPLPFNVRDHDSTLLLARGQVVETFEQMQALFARGALVDINELLSPADRVRQARPEELPALWTDCLAGVGEALRTAPQDGFLNALEAAAPPVLALVQRDPDLAILQVLRQDGNAHVQYGVNHASHAAITSYLVAQRLGWGEDDAIRAFKAALTMNVAMFELQGQLAQQAHPPTPEQREAIHTHPELGRAMLELSGVMDADWLRAVEEHHESPDGRGYPRGLRGPCDTAALIRRADLYTAKLSPRATRGAIAADKAGRMMFMQEPGHPMVAALVKEFGVYPPGCWVRLASGETGLVVRRGATVMTPIVAAMTGPQGLPYPQPLKRDTAHKAFTVHSVLGNHSPAVNVSPATLMSVAAA